MLSTACPSSDRFVKNEYSVYYVTMPKVTDAHRESRREQILVAAWKCFSRNGFHSTSMADVIREANLSAGAVYLYFRSKDEIIVAVATQVFGGIQGRLDEFAQQEPPPSPAEIAAFLVRQPVLAREQAPADLFPLLLAVWSEATRNPTLIPVAEEILGGLRVADRRDAAAVDDGHRSRAADDAGPADAASSSRWSRASSCSMHSAAYRSLTTTAPRSPHCSPLPVSEAVSTTSGPDSA